MSNFMQAKDKIKLAYMEFYKMFEVNEDDIICYLDEIDLELNDFKWYYDMAQIE